MASTRRVARTIRARPDPRLVLLIWALRPRGGFPAASNPGVPIGRFHGATLEDTGKASGDCGPVVAGKAFLNDAQRVQSLGSIEAPKGSLGQTGGVQRRDKAVLSFDDDSLGSVARMAHHHD